MGSWDYTNIGASAKPEHIAYVEKIFEYIGYAPEPGYSEEGEDCTFADPDVYFCAESDYAPESGKIKDCFTGFKPTDLLNLLNALFPNTTVFVHHAIGNNTSDSWDNYDMVYNVGDMTVYNNESYVDYGGGGPCGKRSSKARFILEPPKPEYVSALIDLCKADGNTELLALLSDLSEKLKNGQIVYKDDGKDERVVSEEYDIEEDEEDYDGFEEDDYCEGDEEDGEEDVVSDELNSPMLQFFCANIDRFIFRLEVRECIFLPGKTFVCGAISTGELKVNDQVETMRFDGSGFSAKVKAIVMNQKPVESASAGDNVNIQIEKTDGSGVAEGEIAMWDMLYALNK